MRGPQADAPETAGTANRLARMLDLERAAREAETLVDLGYVIVNDTVNLLPFRQAALFLDGSASRRQVKALSGIGVVDRKAPFVDWIEREAAGVLSRAEGADIHVVDTNQAQDRDNWNALSAPSVLWMPLKDRKGEAFGALWLARDGLWTDADLAIAEQLSGAYAHAIGALRGGRHRSWVRPGPIAFVVAAALLAAGFIPVPRTVLAPAQIVAKEPAVVAAPLDGAIERIVVKPNQTVSPDQPLIEYDQTGMRANRDVAAQALAVAEAELLRARQTAVLDRNAAGRVEGLAGEVELRRAELAYADDQLSRTTVRATHSGIAIVDDPREWTGRPVGIGERIMEIADPERIELRIELPVGTAMDVAPGQEVRMFLDIDPLQPLDGTLRQVGYEAVPRPGGDLAYRLIADMEIDGKVPRIGLRGTAKIIGEDIPLALYLFIRPLAVFRQRTGF